MIASALVREEETVVIGMGEIAIRKQSDSVLTCLGLGSCVAVCAYDPMEKIGGMVHVVLPQSNGADDHCPAKYADTAVALLLREIEEHGGVRSRLAIKLVGGAQLSLAPGLNGAFKIGERNVAMIMAALEGERITVAADDTGGNKGRTVRMFVDTGKVVVRTAGSEIKEL